MEKWKDVKGYEGLYLINENGEVISVRRQGAPGGKVKATTNQDGYLRVKLNKDGRGRRHMAHRLVYETFVGEIPEGCEINHIDEVKTNNNVRNLEAVTHLTNIRHGTGIDRGAKGHHIRVRQYTLEGKFVAEHESFKAAGKAIGVKPCNISSAASGRYRTAGGYYWRKA